MDGRLVDAVTVTVAAIGSYRKSRLRDLDVSRRRMR
jgi:hypothetical protein